MTFWVVEFFGLDNVDSYQYLTSIILYIGWIFL